MKDQFLKKSMEADDLLSCCNKLEALGFAFCENKGELMNFYGEDLGGLVMDLARTIHAALKEAYPVLEDFFEWKGADLNTRLNKKFEQIQNDKAGLAKMLIDESLKEIDSFFSNTESILDWKNRFEKLREERIARTQKPKGNGAPARIDAKAEAPSADLNRSQTIGVSHNAH